MIHYVCEQGVSALDPFVVDMLAAPGIGSAWGGFYFQIFCYCSNLIAICSQYIIDLNDIYCKLRFRLLLHPFLKSALLCLDPFFHSLE